MIKSIVVHVIDNNLPYTLSSLISYQKFLFSPLPTLLPCPPLSMLLPTDYHTPLPLSAAPTGCHTLVLPFPHWCSPPSLVLPLSATTLPQHTLTLRHSPRRLPHPDAPSPSLVLPLAGRHTLPLPQCFLLQATITPRPPTMLPLSATTPSCPPLVFPLPAVTPPCYQFFPPLHAKSAIFHP